MYCKECGKQIDNDSKFCSYCGTKQSIQSIVNEIFEKTKETEAASKNVNINLSFGRSKPDNENTKKELPKIEKYDLTYEKEIGATIAGLGIDALFLTLYVSRIFDYIEDPQTFAIISLINLVFRILVIIWIIKIAKRQNRNTLGWGIFAFLLPVLALIIIGLLRKLNKQPLTQAKSESFQNLSSGRTINDNKQDEVDLSKSQGISKKEETGEIFSESIIFNEIDKNILDDFWGREVIEIKIKFSDGKIGEIFCRSKGKKYYIKDRGWRTYYINKEATIKALYYFLTTKRKLSEGFLYTE